MIPNTTATNSPEFSRHTRYFVPIAAAILMTFGRAGILSFAGRYTLFDIAINMGVILVAGTFGLFAIVRDINGALAMRYLAIIAFWTWIVLRGIVMGAHEYWPDHTQLLTTAVGIILGIHIMRWDLAMVRRSLVGLALLFSVSVVIFEPSAVQAVWSGGLTYRIGEDTAGSSIALPRILYTCAIGCVASIIIEKNALVRCACGGIALLPVGIGLATAGRGGIAGFAFALMIMILGLPLILGLGRKILLVCSSVCLAGILYAGYYAVINFFPYLVHRIEYDADSNRFGIWIEALQDTSLFGRGPGEFYAHNLFLETLQDYGYVGLALLLIVLFIAFRQLWVAYRRNPGLELLWVTGVLAQQLVGQQFSMNLYWGLFWTAIVLPFSLNYGMPATMPARKVAYNGQNGIPQTTMQRRFGGRSF